MSTHTFENEGSAGSKGKGEKNQKIKGKVGPRAIGDRWLNWGIVKNRAEFDGRGRLGVVEDGKFVLWREYSGLTFDELEDKVPFGDMHSDLAYEYASLFWIVTKKFTGRLGMIDWQMDDLGMLFLMKRFEDANASCGFTRAMLLDYFYSDQPVAHGITLTNEWITKMRKRGLIEPLPGLRKWLKIGDDGKKVAKSVLYRVSADGRRVLRQVMDAFREVHKDIRYFAKNSHDRLYLKRLVARFCVGVWESDIDATLEDEEAFDQMVEVTKSDLREAGFKPRRQSKLYKDLPE